MILIHSEAFPEFHQPMNTIFIDERLLCKTLHDPTFYLGVKRQGGGLRGKGVHLETNIALHLPLQGKANNYGVCKEA